MPEITFLNGDCLEVLKDISSNTIDLMICDLPFGCLTQLNKKKSFGGGEGCPWDIPVDLEKFWIEAKRVLKNSNSPVLMFCTTKFGYELIKSNPTWFRYDLVWNKERGTSFLLANKIPLRSHEMIYVFAESGSYYNRIDIEGDFPTWKARARETKETGRTVAIGGEGTWKCSENNGTRCITSVLSFPKKNHRSKTHPTEKPLDLYKFLIERYCPKGGTLLDPTAGSFNSCFAGYEIGRNAIGIEKDETFFNTAVEKLNSLT